MSKRARGLCNNRAHLYHHKPGPPTGEKEMPLFCKHIDGTNFCNNCDENIVEITDAAYQGEEQLKEAVSLPVRSY
jgi:hypothetical protein